MATTMDAIIAAHIESVDSNQHLTIQCATIDSLFEGSSPKNPQKTLSVLDDQMNCLFEDKLRRYRGTVIDIKTKDIVKEGSFFPYEFTEDEQQKCEEKMDSLDHKFEDFNIEYSCEGTIIRIFYHNQQWYISTHRKLDAERSKWGSNNSFKFLFEQGLKESYNLSLKDLLARLNLRCQYTFMLMADESTKFACVPNHSKRIYLIGTTDPDIAFLQIDKLPRPQNTFKTLTDIFTFVKGMKYPFKYQGLLLVHTNGSQYRIISNEYSKLFKVRNNEQSIPYRYLQLKGQNDLESVELLKQLFPQHIATFEAYETYVSQLVDIIFYEYNKRKHRSSTSIEQIDQKLYLFIKNKLLKTCDIVTPDYILKLLWLEESSNLNRMIRMVKHNQKKEEYEQKLIVDLEKVNLNLTPDNPIPKQKIGAPKRKKVKYTSIPIDFSCRKRLF